MGTELFWNDTVEGKPKYVLDSKYMFSLLYYSRKNLTDTDPVSKPGFCSDRPEVNFL